MMRVSFSPFCCLIVRRTEKEKELRSNMYIYESERCDAMRDDDQLHVPTKLQV